MTPEEKAIKAKEYKRRYRERHREAINAKARVKDGEKRRNDPEYAEKRRKSSRTRRAKLRMLTGLSEWKLRCRGRKSEYHFRAMAKANWDGWVFCPFPNMWGMDMQRVLRINVWMPPH